MWFVFKHGNTASSKLSQTALQHIEKSDTMSFPNKPDVDNVISSMVDKFALHGLISQSRRLKKLYEQLTKQANNKEVMVNRLNAVRFLLEASERPTAQAFTFSSSTLQRGDSIEIVNWPEYLREGLERWSPAFDSDSVRILFEIGFGFYLILGVTVLGFVVGMFGRFCRLLFDGFVYERHARNCQ